MEILSQAMLDEKNEEIMNKTREVFGLWNQIEGLQLCYSQQINENTVLKNRISTYEKDAKQMFKKNQETTEKLIEVSDNFYHAKIEKQKLLRSLKLAGIKPGEYQMISKREQNFIDIIKIANVDFETRAEKHARKFLN